MVVTRSSRRRFVRSHTHPIACLFLGCFLAADADSYAQSPIDEHAPAESVLLPMLIRPPPAPGHNTVTWQPITVVWATIDLEYERGLGRFVSVYLASAILPGLAFGRGGTPTPFVFGVAGDLGIRFFPMANAPAGLFAGGYVGATTFYDYLGSHSRFFGSGVRAGTTVGYSLIFLRHVDLSFAVGIEYLRFGVRRGGMDQIDDVVQPTARIALGIAF